MLAPADDPSSPCRWHKSGRDRNQQASKMTWKAVGINVDIIEICCSVWPEKYMNASKAIFSQSGSEKCKSCLHGFAFWILLLLPTNNSKQNPNSWLKSKQHYKLDEKFKNQDDGFDATSASSVPSNTDNTTKNSYQIFLLRLILQRGRTWATLPQHWCFIAVQILLECQSYPPSTAASVSHTGAIQVSRMQCCMQASACAASRIQ